jgi:uncharacterized membrane protein HdeD (DUF308 family)
MTSKRHSTLPIHGVVELALGLVTLASPTLFDFANAGMVAAVVLGSVLTGMAVTLTGDHRPSLGWHHLFDLVIVIATAVAALALAVAGEASAGLYFSALAVLQAALNVTTRYVAMS